MRCSGATVQTCGYYGGACTSWQDTTTCVAPTPFCLEDGSAASCVQCRDATDCAAGEACVNDACCADANDDGACDSVQLTLSGPAGATVGHAFSLLASLEPVHDRTTITIDGHALWCTLAGSVCSASRSVTEQAPDTYEYSATASVGGHGVSASASVRVSCPPGTVWDGSSCVACVGDGDCTDPSLPRCVGGVCVACVGDTDCPSDGWNATGVTRWTANGACSEKKQERYDYLDYGCASHACDFQVDKQEWRDTGATRPANEGGACDADGDGQADDGVCRNGVCV